MWVPKQLQQFASTVQLFLRGKQLDLRGNGWRERDYSPLFPWWLELVPAWSCLLPRWGHQSLSRILETENQSGPIKKQNFLGAFNMTRNSPWIWGWRPVWKDSSLLSSGRITGSLSTTSICCTWAGCSITTLRFSPKPGLIRASNKILVVGRIFHFSFWFLKT